MADFDPQTVLDLWFPQNDHWLDVAAHMSFWDERMQGGMDARICTEFSEMTVAGAQGALDHWAETPLGRLALIIVLDQYPRSLWRGTPAAYAQDIKATRLALEGIENGHYHALQQVFEREFYLIAITHCEGPYHLERMRLVQRLDRELAEFATGLMADVVDLSAGQTDRVMAVIERFGRHPHRNPIYGRVSSPEEEAYIATGDFPHLQKAEDHAAKLG